MNASMVSSFDSENGAILGTFDRNSSDESLNLGLVARAISISALIFAS